MQLGCNANAIDLLLEPRETGLLSAAIILRSGHGTLVACPAYL